MQPVEVVRPSLPPDAGLAGSPELALWSTSDAVKRQTLSERMASVERLRLVAMFEIVAFHVSEQRIPIIGGLGLPVFLLLNNAFNYTLSERMGTRAFLRVKVSRLIMPWVIWSLVYATATVLERVRHDEPLWEDFSPWMLIGGTYPHLWFVPFALFGGVLVTWLARVTRLVPRVLVVVLALLGGSALVGMDALALPSGWFDWPLLQWLFALPATFLGFALGRVLMAADRRLLSRVALATVALAGLTCVASAATFVPEVMTRYAVSMAVVCMAFLWPGRADALSTRLTPLLFGIYLSHPFIHRAYQASQLPNLPVVMFAALVFAAAAVLVLVLRRSRLRFLV